MIDTLPPLDTPLDAAAHLHVYPYVVSRPWVDAHDPEGDVSEPFSNDVFVTLVLDGPGGLRRLQSQDLHEAGLTFEATFAQAASNLSRAWSARHFEFGIARLDDGTLIGGCRGNWMAPAGGLVLGNLYQSMVEHFQVPEFAAVAVNRTFLLAFPTDEKTLSSLALRQLVEEGASGAILPISRSWLRLDGDWPSAYHGEPAF
ncbi:hypothetical protein [Pandoraea apista]|uniref:Uncharacterized protein n=1 Tax=Pandoraea apista TaxID=93218 RepID=A0ABX9ZWN4_9BURK|nr:hypothetical protein [Pandoraea apista]AJE99401.1 hypothetical protein SG18_16495 [Pandoraea apista]AKH73511.1 hypothetical protein XM39_16690 [Pandoraea apista]AKI62058.1 hypothetical protein AA956_10000 [Pandoraea apista]PTE02885.1 hypothetical protein C7830_01330 [Pandoraea apista]RRJ29886.1 hypothetical protein EIB05_15555 [Pandoraea apista]